MKKFILQCCCHLVVGGISVLPCAGGLQFFEIPQAFAKVREYSNQEKKNVQVSESTAEAHRVEMNSGLKDLESSALASLPSMSSETRALGDGGRAQQAAAQPMDFDKSIKMWPLVRQHIIS